MFDLTLRYYCEGEGNKVIRDLLEEVKNKLGIPYEIVGGPYNELKEKIGRYMKEILSQGQGYLRSEPEGVLGN
jgi:hypothetical protein